MSLQQRVCIEQEAYHRFWKAKLIDLLLHVDESVFDRISVCFQVATICILLMFLIVGSPSQTKTARLGTSSLLRSSSKLWTPFRALSSERSDPEAQEYIASGWALSPSQCARAAIDNVAGPGYPFRRDGTPVYERVEAVLAQAYHAFGVSRSIH